jgi:hypothetical protein
MRRPQRALYGLSGALLLCVACAEHAVSPPPEPEHHHHELHLPPVGPSVDVRIDGKTTTVTLAALPHAGTQAALVDLWKAAWPTLDLAGLHFDFVGSDGFHPASRPPCVRLLGSDEVTKGHIDVVTHDLSFDVEPSLPGCYRVHAVVAIEALR